MIQKLTPLIGIWTGAGLITYPTLEDTEYRETLTFQTNDAKTYIQYEQKTWLTESGEQSHWEFGFIRPAENDTLQMFCTHSGGRVEVLSGTLNIIDQNIHINLECTMFGNDPRMVEAKREIIVEKERLRYEMFMSTQTTPNITVHLKAALQKQNQ